MNRRGPIESANCFNTLPITDVQEQAIQGGAKEGAIQKQKQGGQGRHGYSGSFSISVKLCHSFHPTPLQFPEFSSFAVPRSWISVDFRRSRNSQEQISLQRNFASLPFSRFARVHFLRLQINTLALSRSATIVKLYTVKL